MTADALAARLVAAGLDQAEETAKAALFRRAIDRWQGEVTTPWTAWWIPGRLEVFGTHTDYAGGRTLVAPVPRGFAFLVAPRQDGYLRVTDAGDPGPDAVVAIEPGAAPTRFRGWRHYVEVTAARVARNFPGAALGADVMFASDLPRAAGMSSSSALVVGIATAMAHAGDLRHRAEWTRHIRDAVDEAGYLACVENGRSFGGLVGDAGVGTHGGSEDHAAMLAGTAGACTAFSFVPMRQLDTIAVPPAWIVVVCSSGVGSHKTGAERAAYNRLSHGTTALRDLWNAHEAPAGSLAAALATSSSALARLQALVRREPVAEWTGPALRDRLDHFAAEDARVGDAIGALRAADEATFSRLAAASQADAEVLLKNQVPETSALVRVARESGAIAARNFGAGFGGSVWAVVDQGDGARFADRWMAAYRAACPDAAQRSVAFVSRPGPPVTLVGSQLPGSRSERRGEER